MTNAPEFIDFIAERIGHRGWYTRPFPAPVKSRGKLYIKPSVYSAMMAEYAGLFGDATYADLARGRAA